MPSLNRLLVLALACATLLLTTAARAQPGAWKDSDGKVRVETEAMKSKNDFAGMVIVTTDEDWQEKWNTPPETQPSFTKAETVPYGKKVFVLIFFANPKLDGHGRADVECDLKITAPTGRVSLAQEQLSCFAGRLKGAPHHLYLSDPTVVFSGDPGDPVGAWEVQVRLRDRRRGVELPLRTTFGLSEK